MNKKKIVLMFVVLLTFLLVGCKEDYSFDPSDTSWHFQGQIKDYGEIKDYGFEVNYSFKGDRLNGFVFYMGKERGTYYYYPESNSLIVKVIHYQEGMEIRYRYVSDGQELSIYTQTKGVLTLENPETNEVLFKGTFVAKPSGG